MAVFVTFWEQVAIYRLANVGSRVFRITVEAIELESVADTVGCLRLGAGHRSCPRVAASPCGALRRGNPVIGRLTGNG